MAKRAKAPGPDVLVLSPHLAPPAGGIQRLAVDVADALAPKQVRVIGVSEGTSDDPRIRVVRQRHGRLGGVVTTAAYAVAVFAEIRRRPHLVQAMTWRALAPAYLVPRRPPLLLYCMGAELVRAKGGVAEVWLRRVVVRRATSIAAISQYTRTLVESVSGRDARVIHPPIRSVPRGELSRTVNEHVRVLTVGRLVANKGHDRLIRSIASARAKGVPVTLTIVGSGPQEQQLRRIIRELDLADVVRLAGAVSDEERDALYREADIFALLSVPVDGEVEGFGIAFLEANSYELPVVAGRSGGSTDAVEENVSGIVVDNEEEAAEALIVLASDGPLRRALGASGRARLAAFSLEEFGRRLRAWHATVQG